MSSEMRELIEAGNKLLAAMEMQEGRESEALHIAQPTAKHLWDEAKTAWNRALLARTEAGADGEKGVNNHEWPLLDRVEFALRDAGFDYDEAFRIAHLAAAPPQDASGDAEDARRYRWLRRNSHRNVYWFARGVVHRDDLDALIDAAMQAKEAK